MSTNSSGDSLPPGADVGAVSLRVADLDSMIGYYRDGVGLELLEQAGDVAILGRGERRALVLEQRRELRHASPGQAGLFHTAMLFADASELAASVYSVARRYPASFTGSSDHLVSRAFYFDDPEGNGVELYWDRPRAEWQWNAGTVRMGTAYLDPNRFLRENLTAAGAEHGVQGDAGVGHVHLRVGDIATARVFYADTVGFDVTAEFGESALFVSAGGYHHHLGMNTWQSAGAGTRTPALGLGEVNVTVPSLDDVGALRERLAARSVRVRDSGEEIAFDDPWANLIRVTAAT